MTSELATQLAKGKMRDMGISEKDYYFRYRHFVLMPEQKLDIEGERQYFVLTEEIAGVSVRSDFGIFDLSDTSINEQKYEHQSPLTISNDTLNYLHVRFIQIIIKN